MTEIKKIAIYSRKSKFTGVGDSIGNQIAMRKEYCERNYIGEEIEYTVCEEVTKDAEDEIETARVNAEKVIEQMLEKSNNSIRNIKINFI